MKKEPKKKMTIEGLAVVVNNLAVKVDKGFSDVNDKFKEIHNKMDKGFSIARKETEDLAIMVGRGFNDVHEKMDKGFADVNSRLDKVETRLDKVETRLDKVDSKLGQVEYRLVMVEDNQLDLKLRMDVLGQNNKGTDELRGRVVVLEKKVGIKGR